MLIEVCGKDKDNNNSNNNNNNKRTTTAIDERSIV